MFQFSDIVTLNLFEDLEVYKKARALRTKISTLIKTFPKEEKYRLTDQMIRASRSDTHQLAEGFGRYHHQENIQYCRIARGSLDELHDQINTAFDEGYIDSKTRSTFVDEKMEVARMLNGYINYLKKAKSSHSTKLA